MAEEVVLLTTMASMFGMRVQIALAEKGVEYLYKEEDLDNKSPLLLKMNQVHKKIPVLVHNGKPIAESAVILEYIDETWKGSPIMPEDPYEGAMARFWAKFIDEKCLRVLWKACSREGEEQEKAKEEAYELVKTLEDQLKDKKFFGGDNIGFLDIVASFFGHWLPIIEEAFGVEFFTEEKFPRFHKWVDEFVNCNIIKETLPSRDKLLAFIKARYVPIR